MSKEKKHKQAFDFRQLGARKVGHPVPVPTEKEISFESIGGKQILAPSASNPAGKPVDFSHLGGKRIDQQQPAAPEEPKGDLAGSSNRRSRENG